MKRVILTLLAMASTACASTSYIDWANEKYRTGKALSAELGAVGVVRREEKNVFEKRSVPGWAEMQIENLGSVDTKVTRSLLASVGADVATLGKAAGNAELDYGQSVKLDFFAIRDIEVLRNEINKRPDVVAALKRWGKDARIVTTVLLAYDHDRTQMSKGAADLTYSAYEGGTGKIQASVGGTKTAEFKLSDGAILAYEYARFCWSPDGTIGEIRVDRWTRLGDPHCIEGTSTSPPGARR